MNEYVALIARKRTGLVLQMFFGSPEDFDNTMKREGARINWAKLFEIESGTEVSEYPKVDE